jgi:hypothetical protein
MGYLVIIRPSINISWAMDQKNKNKIFHPYVLDSTTMFVIPYGSQNNLVILHH